MNERPTEDQVKPFIFYGRVLVFPVLFSQPIKKGLGRDGSSCSGVVGRVLGGGAKVERDPDHCDNIGGESRRRRPQTCRRDTMIKEAWTCRHNLTECGWVWKYLPRK